MASVAELDRKAKEALGTLPESLGVKERMAIEHQEMPSQDPDVRKHNMDEVALGYSEDIAVLEAQRCLNCKNKPCMSGCPVSIDIPRFIERIQNSAIKEVVLLDTIPVPKEKMIDKFTILPVAPTFAEAIARIYNDKPFTAAFG